MRRSFKVLSVLMIVCLLLGATVFSVFAAKVTGNGTTDAVIKQRMYHNLEGLSGIYTGYKPESTDPIKNYMPHSAKDKFGLWQYKNYLSGDGSIANTYASFSHQGYNDPTKYGKAVNNVYVEIPAGGIAKNISDVGYQYALVNQDFVVVDFDICADAYLTENNELTNDPDLAAKTASGAPKLSYLNGYYSQVFFRYFGDMGDSTKGLRTDKNVNALEIKYSGNTWYLQMFGGGARYALPETINEWTHVTIILEVNNTANYKDGTTAHYDASRFDEVDSFNFNESNLHFYVNGEYLSSINGLGATELNKKEHLTQTTDGGKISSAETWGLDVIRNWFNKAYAQISDFSMGYDNLSTNFYGHGYNGTLAQVKDFSKLNLYDLTDVIYNGQYEISAPNTYPATVTDNGATTSYISTKLALDSASASATVNLLKSVTDYYPKNDLVIILGEGVTFDVASDSGYVASQVENEVRVTKADASQQCDVVWLVGDYIGDDYTATVTLDGSLEYNGPAVNPIYVSSGVYNNIVGWQWYDPEEEEYVEVDTLTDYMIEIALDDTGSIELEPVFGAMNFKYTLTEADGKTLIPDADGTYDSFVEGIVPANYPNGSILTLYSDMTFEQIAIAKNNKFTLDINGFTATFTHQYGVRPQDGSELNIYSSVKGGKIFTDKWFIYYTNSSYSKAMTVNLGRKGDGSDSFTVYSAAIMDFAGPRKTVGADPSADAITKINLYGGSYYRVQNQTYAMFNLRINCEFRAYDAFIAATNTTSSGSKIITDDFRYYSSMDAKFENCVIYSIGYGTTKAHILRECHDYDYELNDGSISSHHSRVELSGCKLIGNFLMNYNGSTEKYTYNGEEISGSTFKNSNKKAIFTNGTLIASTVDIAGISVGEGLACMNMNPEAFSFTLNYCPSVTDHTLSKTEVISGEYVYFIGQKQEATVNWYDGNGNLIFTEQAAVGAYAQNDGSKVPSVDLGNGIYNLGFKKWVDKDGNDADLFIYEAGATYNFYADCSGIVLAQNIAGVKVGFSLYTNYQMELYFPLSTLPENVRVLGAYDTTTGAAITGSRVKNVTVDGVEYLQSIRWPTAVAFHNQFSNYFLIEVTYEGETYELFYNVKLSVFDYTKWVLDSGKFTEDGKEKTLVANMLNYAVACGNEATDEINAEVAAYLAKYDSLIYKYNSLVIDENEKNVDYSALSDVLTSVTFNVGGSQPGYYFSFDSEVVKSVAVSYKSISGVTMSINKDRNDPAGVSSHRSLPLYNVCCPINIKVTLNDGTVVTGTYSLAEYITVSDAAGVDTTIAKALYGYALASYNYKISD